MGLWIPELERHSGETAIFQAGVNLFRGRRQLGGRITVTDARVVFLPNRLDGILGAHRIEAARADIVIVTVEPPGTETARTRGLSARLRPQVEIHLPHATLVMTVRYPDRLVQALQGTAG